jgi:hypothetical protein
LNRAEQPRRNLGRAAAGAMVPDSGHFLAEENPDFVSSQITAFVDTHSKM